MIAQNLTTMELKNFLEELIRGLLAETPPIVAASGALCTGLRQTLLAGFSEDNALGFTNRTLGGLMFWVGLRERLTSFSESREMRGRYIPRPPLSCLGFHQLLLLFIAHQSLEILLVATMDLGKRPGNLLTASNSKLYMDLKDIIREQALPFLPAKSLFRFLAVCRDWKHQISAPFFHHNQSLCFRGTSGLFCQTPENAPVFIPIHPKSCGVPDPSLSFMPEPVVIRASSNGLLCCQGRDEDRYYYLCNPVTKQFKKLPKPTACHGSEPALVVIFEPSLLNFVPEYKLICAFQSADFDDATEFEIYTSKNNTWNVSGELCFGAKKVSPRSGVHVNGVVFWTLASGGILCFDLRKDRSQLLGSYYYARNCVLGTFGGRLCKVSITNHSAILSVLDNIHSNTMEIHSRSKMWDNPRSVFLDTDVLKFDANGTKVVSISGDILVVKSGNNLYSYDFKSKETKALSQPVELNDAMICVPYGSSLVSL
nr:F-box protein At5g49610-like isoform X2 [Ipomoea batatas]